MNFELIADQAAECLLADLNDGHCVDIDPVDYETEFFLAGFEMKNNTFLPTHEFWIAEHDYHDAAIEIDYILELMSRGFDYEFSIGCYADVNPF